MRSPDASSRISIVSILLAMLVALSVQPAWSQSPGATSSAAAGPIVTIAVDRFPETFDPASLQPGPATVLANVNEPLARLAPNRTDLDPATSLAESLRSEDGRVWKITLKAGLLFSDGSSLDSKAVAFSLGRLLQADHPARPASPAIPLSARGLVKSITTPTPTQVVVELTEPYGPMLTVLTSVVSAPLSPASFKDGKLTGLPVGCGPFVVSKNGPGRKLELIPNARFHRQRPKVSRVDVVWCPRGSARFVWLLAGRGDIAEGLTKRDLDDINARPDFRTEAPMAGLGVVTLYINPQVAPFQATFLREAVVRATPDDLLGRHLFDGACLPVRTIYPPIPWVWKSAGAFPTITYDPLAAKQLLGMGDVQRSGTAFVLWAVPPAGADARSIARFLEEFRIAQRDLNVSVLTDVVAPDRLEKRLSEGPVPAALLVWTSPRLADPEDLLWASLDKRGPLAAFVGLAGDEFQKTLAEARRKDSQTTREFLYGEVEKRLARDVTVIPLAAPLRTVAYRQRIGGLKFETDGITALEEVRLGP